MTFVGAEKFSEIYITLLYKTAFQPLFKSLQNTKSNSSRRQEGHIVAPPPRSSGVDDGNAQNSILNLVIKALRYTVTICPGLPETIPEWEKMSRVPARFIPGQ